MLIAALALAAAAPAAGDEPLRRYLDLAWHNPGAVRGLLQDAGGMIAGAAGHRRAALVVLLHGDDLALFAGAGPGAGRAAPRPLRTLAERLARTGRVRFVACDLALRRQGLAPRDLPPFFEVVDFVPAAVTALEARGFRPYRAR